MAPPGSVGPGAGRGARGTPGASPRGAGGRDTTEGTPRGLVSPSSPRRAGPGLSVAQRGPGLQLPSAPARGTPFPGALWRLGAAQRACVAAERRRRALRHLVPVPEQCERCGAGRSPVGDGDRREEPGAGSDDGNAGKLSMLHPAWVLVLAVLVVLALALAVALAVVSGRCEGNAGLPVAQVLPCPNDWVGYRDVCYYLSREEGSWEWSQEQCSSHGASLAVLKRDWEVEFLLRLKGNIDYWLGLQRQGEHLQWVDGSSFNDTILVQGQEPCLFLKDDHLGSSSCSQHRPYLCSKPQL
ncbi:C-type lectin domain family 2 member D-like isoform X5 [Ciconia boyciana]|uniref:C-type lectin domain family 2 member D-like isoform X5 n=1 Tax=Ciconia boyciana TaxID=52775 RepID=UPI003BA39B9A